MKAYREYARGGRGPRTTLRFFTENQHVFVLYQYLQYFGIFKTLPDVEMYAYRLSFEANSGATPRLLGRYRLR